MVHAGTARALLATMSCLLTLGMLGRALAFDNTRNDNLAVYWGQDSEGSQQRLSFYCQDSTIDVFPLAFLYIFRGTGGEPVIDFANTCNQWDDPVYPGTALANCSFMAEDIKTCQASGKLITLSLGGATGQIGFSSDAQAESFADQIWDLFLGGESSIRPFGDAVLDGVDLDIESGTPAHYAAFVNRIRSNAGETTPNPTSSSASASVSHASASSSTVRKTSTGAVSSSTHRFHSITSTSSAVHHKPSSTPVVDVTNKNKYYYITAAPQCPYPDAYIGAALNEAPFDAVYVQFYNNYCGLDQPADYNFETWDTWAKTLSANPNVKVYIGAPGSQDAAGEGYVNVSTLASYVADAQQKYSSFGGVMLWDADTAYTNGRFDRGIKTAMVASAEEFTPGQAHRDAAGFTKTEMKTKKVAEAKSLTPVEKPRVRSRFFRL